MEAVESLFKAKYNAVKKMLSFNPLWMASAGCVRKMVVDTQQRLMLQEDEWCKTADKSGTQYIAVGTAFGIIVFHQRSLFGKPMFWYETTKSLTKITSDWGITSPSGLASADFLKDVFEGTFLERVKAAAQAILAEGGEVGDRIPIPKAKPGRKNQDRPNKDIWAAAKKKFDTKRKKEGRKPVLSNQPRTEQEAKRPHTQKHHKKEPPQVKQPKQEVKKEPLVQINGAATIDKPLDPLPLDGAVLSGLPAEAIIKDPKPHKAYIQILDHV